LKINYSFDAIIKPHMWGFLGKTEQKQFDISSKETPRSSVLE